MAHIWRLQGLGIAYETVAGTKESATAWIPKTSWVIKPVIETVKDTSWYGLIDEVYETNLANEYSQADIEWILCSRSIGYLLLWTLWASAISWWWPYTHSFTVLNTNSHPTFTLWAKDPVESFSTSYNMINEFSIEATAWEYVNFNASFTGKKKVTETPPTTSYSAVDYPFRARDVKVYFSDTEWSWWTAISLNRIKLTISKNLYLDKQLWNQDLSAIYNQQFTVSWDFEWLFDSLTIQNYVRNGTNKFMKIEIINTDVTMTPSWNPTLTFILWKTLFETRDETDANNDIVMQTVWFTGGYNVSSTYTIKASLINEVSADYDA